MTVISSLTYSCFSGRIFSMHNNEESRLGISRGAWVWTSLTGICQKKRN